MKEKILFYLSLACSIVASAAFLETAHAGSADLQRAEVAIGDVFIPQAGYDDNDRVLFTVDGFLPNTCYQIADTQVQRGQQPGSYIIHQFADRRTDGVCADLSHLPLQMQSIVPYTLNVSMGQLSVGSYTLLFDLQGTPRKSVFSVSRALSPGIDDDPYAAVSSVEIPDVVNGAEDVKAVLRGTLTTTCQYVRSVRILQEPLNRVIVVLPVVGYRQHVLCAQILFPFAYPVDLGRLGEGRYLIHVRSMNGRAVTRVFSVVRPDP